MKSYEEHVSTVIYPDGALLQTADVEASNEAVRQVLALSEAEAKGN